MSTITEPVAKVVRRKTKAAPVRVDQKSREYQDSLWAKWPTPADWPGSLNIYEAAAYKRISYDTVWTACQCGSDGKSRLAHQRFGNTYRLAKAALDAFGAVKERSAA